MKILLISSKTYPSKGGVEFIVDTLATGLQRKSHDVTVVTNFYRSTTAGLRDWKGFVRWFGESLFKRIKAILGLGDFSNNYKSLETYFIAPGISKIRTILSVFLFPITFFHYLVFLLSIRPEIINLHFADNATLYVLITKILFPKIKIVLSLHGEDALRFTQNSFHKSILKALIVRSDSVVVVSNTFAKKAQKAIGYNFKYKVVYNCVDDDFLTLPIEPLHPSLPRSYILSIGRLVHKKGFDVLISAFRKFQGKTKGHIHLVVMGSGEKIDELKKMSAGLWIHFLGSQDRETIINALDHCEFFVSPSRDEPFGIVNIEAMSRKRAVLATRVGGVPEYIADSKNGLLVKSDSINALSEAMIRMYEDNRLRGRLSKAGYDLVKKKFTESTMISNYIEIYNQL